MHTPLCHRFLSAALLAVFARAATAAPALGGEGSLAWDDNIGNAGASSEADSALVIDASVHAEQAFALGAGSQLSLRGSLGAEGYSRFSRLSNGSAGLRARLTTRPSGAFYAPTLGLSAAAAYLKTGSDLRDGGEYRAALFLNQQITTQFSARLTAAWSQREASGTVFDLEGRSLGLDLDWSPAPALALYGGWTVHSGDQVSSSAPAAQRLAAAQARAADDVFDAGTRIAYRMRARTQIGTLGLNYALSPRYALDTQLQGIRSESDFDNRYRRMIARISLLARF